MIRRNESQGFPPEDPWERLNTGKLFSCIVGQDSADKYPYQRTVYQQQVRLFGNAYRMWENYRDRDS